MDSLRTKQDSSSSFKSRDSQKSKHDSIKRRVEKFNDEKKKYAGEKDEEYAGRRKRKKERKEQIARDRRLRQYKCLYWPSGLIMLCGFVFILGATIQSISEGSLLWKQRQVFRIIGPVFMVFGLVLFFITVAFVNNHTIKVKKLKAEEDIKRKKERRERILLKYKMKQKEINFSRKPLARSISGTSSATCHTLDEFESSAQFITGSLSNGCLHPNWKPFKSKDSVEDDTSKTLQSFHIESSAVNKKPLTRSISGPPSTTCESTAYLPNGTKLKMSNGCLRSYRKLLNKKDSYEFSESFECLENNSSSSSSLVYMTSLPSSHITSSASACLLSKIPSIDETEELLM
ncbi:unnamed protein product [Mytilus coruscus]|uniref:Uncharacterized protein n=1 Tax=Mytilus coruscus TaxID=42192 RepID=A0A6J8EGA1_MYTCO|nr:unnamed protein product [Mytilus coruscus]